MDDNSGQKWMRHHRTARDKACWSVIFDRGRIHYFFSGSDKGGSHGVGIAVRDSIVREGGCEMEFVSDRLMKMRILLHGKSNAITCIAGYAPTEPAAESVKTKFWSALNHATEQTPKKDQLFVLMDANARTGRRGDGAYGVGSKVLGAYGRDVENVNGGLLLGFADDNDLASRTPVSAHQQVDSHTLLRAQGELASNIALTTC